MLAEVGARLEARVPEFAGRVRSARDFAHVQASGAAPSGGVTVYVLPSVTQGIPTTASGLAVGLFRQAITRGVAVVTILQSTDPLGSRALDRIEGVLEDLHAALCGWAPEETTGVFELSREQMAPSQKGLLAYVTEFRIADQLRIST
jgi:hypothetical protein